MTKGSFGEILKREREMREVTLNEVTVATRIPPRFLEAFEREEWEKLPGGVFNRGFVRAIARYLGLDEENLLSEYDLAYGGQNPAMPAVAENRIPSPPKWIVAVAALGIMVAIAGVIAGSVYGLRRYAVYRAAKHAAAAAAVVTTPQPPDALPNGSGEPSSSPASTSPRAPAAPAFTPGTPVAAKPTRLNLSVSTAEATRVRVVADGRVVLDAHLPAGDIRHLYAWKQFVVTVAQPSAVLLEMNGQAMPQLGSGGASGTIVLGQKDLRQAPSGNSQR
jgi:cytoskeleton protein RodZ